MTDPRFPNVHHTGSGEIAFRDLKPDAQRLSEGLRDRGVLPGRNPDGRNDDVEKALSLIDALRRGFDEEIGLRQQFMAEALQRRIERDRWIRAFNRLEKAVTNHIEDRCIDSDDLAHVHEAVMRDLGPKESHHD